MQCGGCGRGALALIYCGNEVQAGKLIDFYPFSIESAPIPKDTPDEIEKEFREAELCSTVGANRAASAMLRSALEKTLKKNGYNDGNLKNKIDLACADGLITESRKKCAHDEIRSLGNDVLHDAWQFVDDKAVEIAHKYTQRIIEDFYDERETAEKLLRDKNRV